MSIGVIAFPILVDTSPQLIALIMLCKNPKVHSTTYTFIRSVSKGSVWKAFSQLYCLSPP